MVLFKATPRDRVLVGPLWPGRELRRMVRVLNDCFGLRDCPGRIAVAFAEQAEILARCSAPRCIRHELGTCLGPCTGACTSRRYADHVRRARAFLCGTDRSVLTRLERAMRAAADAERYQCAASIRDQWRDLTALDELLERVRTVERTCSFVYPLPSYRSGETWYLIHRGQVVDSVAAPGSPRSARRAMEILAEVYPAGPRRVDHSRPDDPDLILLVSLWFRAHPQELDRTIAPDAARQWLEASRATSPCAP